MEFLHGDIDKISLERPAVGGRPSCIVICLVGALRRGLGVLHRAINRLLLAGCSGHLAVACEATGALLRHRGGVW